MAAMYGHYEVAEVLLEAGISRDARTKVDKSALHLAATEGFTNIVELLLMNRTEVNCRDMVRRMEGTVSLETRGDGTTDWWAGSCIVTCVAF